MRREHLERDHYDVLWAAYRNRTTLIDTMIRHVDPEIVQDIAMQAQRPAEELFASPHKPVRADPKAPAWKSVLAEVWQAIDTFTTDPGKRNIALPVLKGQAAGSAGATTGSERMEPEPDRWLGSPKREYRTVPAPEPMRWDTSWPIPAPELVRSTLERPLRGLWIDHVPTGVEIATIKLRCRRDGPTQAPGRRLGASHGQETCPRCRARNIGAFRCTKAVVPGARPTAHWCVRTRLGAWPEP